LTVRTKTERLRGPGAVFRRGLFRVLVALLIIAGLLAGGLWLFARSRLPQVSGRAALSGLKAPVTVTRDEFGIPQIRGESLADVMAALGYVHAQDRFWQMEQQRRVAQGRLAEFAGERLLSTDVFLRRMGLYRAAQQAYETLDPGAQAILQAYALGVNAWLAGHRNRLPLEFSVLALGGRRIAPDPWIPADSLAWQKMMAYDLSGNFSTELLLAEVRRQVGVDQADDLFPAYPADGPIIVPGGAGGSSRSGVDTGGDHGFAGGSLAGLDASAAVRGHLPGTEGGLGSNNWVVAGWRTESGYPLLANDPHLSIQKPSIWYLARLEAPGFHALGATLPGVPGVVIGRNERIAWGVTNAAPDTQDLYLETIDPADSGRYLFRGETLAFERREEEIVVAGGGTVRATVLESRHGPILFDARGATLPLDGSTADGAMALRWTALDLVDTTLEAFLGINQAGSWEEFADALRAYVTPAQNFVYADVDGNIGYLLPGRIPIRASGEGRVPVRGDAGAFEWLGYIPFDELPRLLNPPEGVIVTANHKITGDAYPYFISAGWTEPFRARRILELLGDRTGLALVDMRQIQADQASLLARELLPLLLATPVAGDDERRAIELLAAWDQVMHPLSTPAAVFLAWYAKLLPRLVADELGEQVYARYAGNRPRVLLNLLSDPEGRWCNDVRTPERETCAEIQRLALRDALDDLRGRLGDDEGRWFLGSLRSARFVNEVGAALPVLGGQFTRSVQVGGDPFTVNPMSMRYSAPFAVSSLASYRQILDLSPAAEGVFVHTLGQSGHPLSPNYADLLPRWLEVSYLRMDFGDRPTGPTLTLRP
jgi:penicillin amidase